MTTGFVNSLGYAVPFGVTLGGTGAASFTAYAPVIGGTTTTAALASASSGISNSGYIFTSTGTGSAPTWQALPSGTNITWKNACYAATTAALTVTYANGTGGIGATLTNAGAQAAFAIDGVSPALNSRVLIKNQASDFQNGIYSVTTVGSGSVNWVLTRVTDYDAAAEISVGDMVFVTAGTVNAAQEFWQTQTVAAIGTGNPIDFSEFSGPGVTSIAGTASQIDVSAATGAVTISIDAGYLGQTSITTLGTITSGTWTGTTIAVAHGGTGAATFTAYSPIFAGTTSTGVMQSIAIGTAGQVLMSNGASALASFQTPSYGLTYSNVTGTTVTTAPNLSYGLQNSAEVTVTMGASAGFTLGQQVAIEGYGANGFVINFVGSQVCNAYNGISTSTAGSITTRDPANTTNSVNGCRVVLRYTATDTFELVDSNGNFAFA